ncbi:MAG: glycoside hydrolase family 127 protein, partial [Eubacteriales bacterium]|nr:glycoside hydrolase family 127 protein [Eubacteriales bacterium]
NMSSLPEDVLMALGADALRVCGEMYRRTGQKFLLAIMERCRAQLPDVSGMFHSFPFLRAFAPEKTDPAAMDETSLYYRRMERLGTGALTADALAITASLALYSGSARDASASKAGVSALQRYHGLPSGAFSADPYLAGRDPSRSSDLYAVCAYAEALYDLLAASGDLSFAEKLEVLTQNALANFFTEDGVRATQSVNRLADDPGCAAAAPAPAQTSSLLRALYAVRRAVWMVKAEDELCMLLPYDGCCLTRMGGVPVRITAETKDFGEMELSVEARKPVAFALSLRVPSWSDGASVGVNGGKPQHADANTLFTLRREFKTGDTVQLHLPCEARVETGFRGSASVFCGPVLMALPLPETNAAWQYALDSGVMPKLEIADGRPLARVDACDAMDWTARQGVIAPPPQGMRMGAGYELTLLPYAETAGRIAAFPQAGNRE